MCDGFWREGPRMRVLDTRGRSTLFTPRLPCSILAYEICTPCAFLSPLGF